MQQSFIYPSTPSPNMSLYDSGYSSPSFHFSSCPYSNESFYIPPYSVYPPFVSSTPLQSSNVSFIPSVKYSLSKHRRQHANTSPSLYSARKRISDEAIEHLNAFYSVNKHPTETEKDRLSLECNITLAQVNTWFNNARSRRGDTNTKLTQKLLKQQIECLSNQITVLQQEQLLSPSPF